jgi:crossover junction endodeoxyribonuclease RuvC
MGRLKSTSDSEGRSNTLANGSPEHVTGIARVEPVFASQRDSQPTAPRRAPSSRVLGIDPGLTRCGYAVVDGRGPNDVTAVSMGVIRTAPTDELPNRLAELRDELVALIREFEPDVVSVERVFFQVNVRTAMSVGQASGLALCEAASAGCEVAQYTPNQVKDAVAGYGSATKDQVTKMVQARLKLPAPPKPADAADAAALALCHLAMAPMTRRIAAATSGMTR